MVEVCRCPLDEYSYSYSRFHEVCCLQMRRWRPSDRVCRSLVPGARSLETFQNCGENSPRRPMAIVADIGYAQLGNLHCSSSVRVIFLRNMAAFARTITSPWTDHFDSYTFINLFASSTFSLTLLRVYSSLFRTTKHHGDQNASQNWC